MPKIIPIGPSTEHVGKSLWEILGNLRHFGVGRLVKRNIYERYPEPTYFRILKVETLANPKDSKDSRKVRAYTERVFRGRKYDKVFELCHETWKPDYVLVPKAQEKAIIEKAEAAAKLVREKTLPPTISFPPLLKELIIQERASKGLPVTEEPKLKLVIRQDEYQLSRIVKDGEKPTIEYKGGKGTPLSPQMYEIPDLYKNKSLQ